VQRLQYLVAAGTVAVLALWLAVSGLNGQASWSQLATTGDTYGLYALPGLLGLALGAQLVATEIERGTNRVAWTQSITRWLTGKLLVGGLVTAGLVALLMPLLGWWIGAMRTGPGIVPKYFGVTGVASVGYAVSLTCWAPPSGP
jgi:ABC-type transport system involved in multi-copper enzyme maturation permease subunit